MYVLNHSFFLEARNLSNQIAVSIENLTVVFV